MLIISQNLTNYDISLPNDAIFRINLAWVNSLDELSKLLKKHENQAVFLDLPRNRTKPPHNKYSFKEISEIIKKFSNVRYFAISNIDQPDDLNEYIELLSDDIVIVPKIESHIGVKNIDKIISKIKNPQKIIMLDHDDLYTNLLKHNESPEKFSYYINNLSKFCKENNIEMLRTIGIIFASETRDVTGYTK